MMADEMGGGSMEPSDEIQSFLNNTVDTMLRGIDLWEYSFFMVVHNKGDHHYNETLTLQMLDTMQCMPGPGRKSIELVVKRYRRPNIFERFFKMYDRHEDWMPDGNWVLLSDHYSGSEDISDALAEKIFAAERSWRDDKHRLKLTKSSQRQLAERRQRVVTTYYSMER